MTTNDDTVNALLDAHVAYVLARSEGDALAAWLEREIDAALHEADEITLGEAVTSEMIEATALGYAVDFELAGGIPELVGEVARAVHTHPAHQSTRLSDLLSDRAFEQYLDKALELHALRAWLVHALVTQPVYAELATDLVVEGLWRVLGPRAGGASRGRFAALGHGLFTNALPELEDTLYASLRGIVRTNLEHLLRRSERFLLDLDDASLRALALRLWEDLSQQPVASAVEQLSSGDVEELFVLGYEHWRELRTTDHYRAMIETGIRAFFAKYAETSLRELLDEVGVTRETMVREAMRFAPPVLAVLREKGVLERHVRRQLEGFYGSPEARAALGATRGGAGAGAA